MWVGGMRMWLGVHVWVGGLCMWLCGGACGWVVCACGWVGVRVGWWSVHVDGWSVHVGGLVCMCVGGVLWKGGQDGYYA